MLLLLVLWWLAGVGGVGVCVWCVRVVRVSLLTPTSGSMAPAGLLLWFCVGCPVVWLRRVRRAGRRRSNSLVFTHTVFLPAPVPHADSDGNAEGRYVVKKFRVDVVVGKLVSWHCAVVCWFFVNFLSCASAPPRRRR